MNRTTTLHYHSRESLQVGTTFTMICELSLTPAGHLFLSETESGGAGIPVDWMKKVANAFSSCQAAGLFELAASRADTPTSPSVSYWREFSCRYLTELCRTPEFSGNRVETIEPPRSAEIETMLISVPPMRGAEYFEC
jgi:hypothetical protein